LDSRVKLHIENSYINLDDIAPIVIPENPPWLNPKPTFNFELTQYKKFETNSLLIKKHSAEIRPVTSEYSAIYTDGSKDGDGVALAAVFGQQVYSVRLPSASSIFSAEANAILLALKFVAFSDKSKLMICSDFKSFIMKYILKRWDQQIHNKLHEIHSLVGKTPCSYGHNRKEQVVLTRCLIGHDRLTHSYLLNNEERPECIPYNSN